MHNLRTNLQISITIFCVLSIVALISCTSTKETTGPYLKQQLIEQGLISETVADNAQLRIIYPPVAKDETIRNLINFYIDKHPEIQEFLGLGKASSSTHEQTDVSGIYKLGLYFYEISYRNNIISIAIEADYSAPGEMQFSNWYSINFDSYRNKLFSYSFLFEQEDLALETISNYIKQDLTRQKKLRGIDVSTDPFLKMESNLFRNLLNSFVILPSTQKKSSFSGIRIYLNHVSDIEEGKYAVNIPSSVFKNFLNPDIKNQFIDEYLPLIIEKPVRTKISTFPDLIFDF